MKSLLKKYSIHFAILTISFLGAWLLPVKEISQTIILFPGAAALFHVLYQIMRDEWQHERNLDLQVKQQDFILSTSSHIADVVYDKHVLFCEEYVTRVQEGRLELLRDGSSPNTMRIGGDLVKIRQAHSAWLSNEIEDQLKPFEQALIKIGAHENYLNRTVDQGMDDRKKQIIDELYRSLGLVLGHESALTEEETNIRIDMIIDRIRDVLGIKAMTELRAKAMNVALQRLKD